MAVKWDAPKDPSELKDYSFDWSGDLGDDTIASASAALVAGAEAGLTIVDGNDYSGELSTFWVSGGTAGQTALIRGTIITAGGRTLEKTGVLRVVDSADPAQTKLDRLQADLEALQSARITLLKGDAVKEVARDGRRLVKFQPSIPDINNAIALLEREIADLTATTNGTRRRRALTLSF